MDLVVKLKDLTSSIWDFICRKFWIDKGFAKWLLIFGGISLTSRFFLYKIYYPTLIRYFSPQTSGAAIFISYQPPSYGNGPNKRISVSQDLPPAIVRRESVKPLFQKSLYNKDVRWKNSSQAASRVTALVNAVITAYTGFKVMKEFGITADLVRAGPDASSKDIPPVSLDLINMNMAYCAWDMFDILMNDGLKNNEAYIFHHSLVDLAGFVMKKVNRCSEVWLFTYPWSDIPTIMMHSSWFARHAVQNLNGLFQLFKKKSVREAQPQVKYEEL